MSQRGLLYDIIADAWTALTPEQRICWHFTAAKNPILLGGNELFTENGWQFFVDKNSPLAIINPDLILNDPPTDETPPNIPEISGTVWPLPGKTAAGPSKQRSAAAVTFKWPSALKNPATITQGYTEFSGAHDVDPLTQRVSAVFTDHQAWITTGITGEYLTTGVATPQRPTSAKKNRRPSTRHAAVYAPSDPDTIRLDTPTGYYATTAGENKFATIRGLTARRRPDLPLGKALFINTANGRRERKTIPNPTGGSVSQVSRPRHYP